MVTAARCRASSLLGRMLDSLRWDGFRSVSTLSSLPPPAIDKLLVANRGEIACRVMATARALGIPTVAVFSEADANALHVSLADEALCIGPAPAKDSYLRVDRVLEVAAATRATAIHPGYGFLSENSGFAAACAEAGVAFVGPPPEAIEAMGDKSRAKALMASAGVPVVPGYHGDNQEDDFLQEEAHRVGFPLLVKAVMGGGGKGMKLATKTEEFMEALHSARREAAAAFGDDRVLLERFIQAPRHVEVQLMADGRGNAYYLAERDCSVQRRHQKVIEEAPAPGVSRQFRAALGKSAVDAARAVGYRNAGTVEFIVDSKTDEHYFMEMNTRLQVEHPVTEAVCGVDLVELQLRVAAGESLANLGLNQEDLEPQGHAVEARLYAENPANNFLPAGGKLLRWRMPPGSTSFAFSPTADSTGCGSANDNDIDMDQTNDDGAPRPSPSQHQQKSRAHAPVSVRIDSGVREGDLVGVHYDPMIAKVVVKAGDRPTALRALSDALGQLQASGVPTNAAFVRRVLGNEEFKTVAVDTSFISRHEEELLAPEPLRRDVAAFAAAMLLAGDGLDASAAAAAAAAAGAGAAGTSEGSSGARGPWALADAFRVNHKHSQKVVMTHVGSGRCMDADVAWVGGSVNGFIVRCKDTPGGGGGGGGGGDEGDSGEGAVTVRSLRFDSKDRVVAVVDGRLLKAEKCSHVHGDEEVLDVWIHGQQHQFRRPVVRRWTVAGAASGSGGGAGVVASPMPGKVIKVLVKQGDAVQQGDSLCVIEAMKMEHAVKAPLDGIVAELKCFAGAQVEDGQVLAMVVSVAMEEEGKQAVGE